MAFLQFPIYFSEDDFESKEACGLSVEKEEGIITVNTTMICGYNENDNGCVMLRMANGDCWELPIKIKDFESILFKTEMLVTLSLVKEN